MPSRRGQQLKIALADPPRTHPDAPGGIWGTERWCYEFIADTLPEGARTLETGCGISTVLFAQWSAEHVCVVPFAEEEQRTRAWLSEHRVPAEHVLFKIGWSDEVLPSLDPGPLDLVLVDGGHAFPSQIIDWFYAGQYLKQGGILVLDDTNLPQVRLGMIEFLDRDPRWQQVSATSKWRAYRKMSAGHLREEWTEQPFLGTQEIPGAVARLRDASPRGELRRELRAIARERLKRR
jgi:hypothetical protein